MAFFSHLVAHEGRWAPRASGSKWQQEGQEMGVLRQPLWFC